MKQWPPKAICLAENSEIINQVFTPMEHYVPINNFDEFFDKLNFCLSDIKLSI